MKGNAAEESCSPTVAFWSLDEQFSDCHQVIDGALTAFVISLSAFLCGYDMLFGNEGGWCISAAFIDCSCKNILSHSLHILIYRDLRLRKHILKQEELE
jgi:hypothetical protein